VKVGAVALGVPERGSVLRLCMQLLLVGGGCMMTPFWRKCRQGGSRRLGLVKAHDVVWQRLRNRHPWGFAIFYHCALSSTAAMASSAVVPGSAARNFSSSSAGINIRLPSFRYGSCPRARRCRKAFSVIPAGGAASAIVRYFLTGSSSCPQLPYIPHRATLIL
jgi:hypothetical protein